MIIVGLPAVNCDYSGELFNHTVEESQEAAKTIKKDDDPRDDW